jgi:hypothetical protein
MLRHICRRDAHPEKKVARNIDGACWPLVF